MTNYINEMIKTAGCKPYYLYYYRFGASSRIALTKEQVINNHKVIRGRVYSVKNRIPDFTAEKQLEIIKLILKSDNIDELNQYYSEIRKCYVFNTLSLPDELGFKSSWTAENKNYDLALAELVVMLMNAGELGKQKVKEVLEGC